jgi:hypothetical protein
VLLCIDTPPRIPYVNCTDGVGPVEIKTMSHKIEMDDVISKELADGQHMAQTELMNKIKAVTDFTNFEIRQHLDTCVFWYHQTNATFTKRFFALNTTKRVADSTLPW